VLAALVCTPLLFALAALAVPSERLRPWLLPACGLAHLALVVAALSGAAEPMAHGWLVLDQLGRPVLGFLSVLFLVCALYAPGYLAQRPGRKNRVFCACVLAALGTLTLLVVAHHLGLMWVALETTTLASAPLIYFNHNARSIEATWKYLLIGSVGIALALLGSFFLAYGALRSGLPSTLVFEDLVRYAPQISKPWLHASFVLLLVGFGTKMGLAPMHSWKPDAYGEAPGLVGTLLAGGLTSGAFVAILRFFHICNAAGDGEFARQLLIALGLLSMAVAGVFMVRQRDFKRMLAYSSVEHMGILVLGIGIGGEAVFGSLLHLVNNGLCKAVLFLSAGNIHRAFGSKRTEHVSGALRRVPGSAALFLAGFFAITGSPPFGPFMSELTIVRGAFGTGHYAVGAAFLFFLFVIFIGMGATVLGVVQGDPPEGAPETGIRDRFSTLAPIVLALGMVLLLGVYIPEPVDRLLRDAASFLEVQP